MHWGQTSGSKKCVRLLRELERILGDKAGRERADKYVHALMDGDINILTRWLRQGGRHHLEMQFTVGIHVHTPLTMAAGCGRNKAVLCLLNARARVDPTDFGPNSALVEACQQGHVECTRTLLEAGADPRRISSKIARILMGFQQRDALGFAELLGHTECKQVIVRRLLELCVRAS